MTPFYLQNAPAIMGIEDEDLKAMLSMHILPDIEREKLSRFLNSIFPWKEAYANATLSVIGVKRGDVIEVLRAKMFLLDNSQSSSELVVETNTLIACRVVLKEINESYETALEKLATSELPTPFGTIKLTLTAQENSPSCHYSSNGPISGNVGKRTNYLSIRGARSYTAAALDAVTWELMAAKRPYGSLSELADDLSIPRFTLEDNSFIEAIADSVLVIDKAKQVSGEEATLGVILSPGLRTDACSLGYVVTNVDGTVSRGRVEGHELEWEAVGSDRIGRYRLAVLVGAVVKIYAVYNGNPQDAEQIFDPHVHPNHRHAIHEAFDAEYLVLKRYLFDEKNLQKNSRDLEVGIAILFFMLGFAIDPLVGKPLEDAPDMIACSAGGDMLLIECTTSQIDKDGKLSKLMNRVAIVKAKLREGPANNVRVLPMIITSGSSEFVAAMDRKTADEQGIIVWAKEDLEAALTQARFPHDSNGLFERYWQSSAPESLDPLQHLISLPLP